MAIEIKSLTDKLLAIVQGANLRGADLQGADLQSANLRGANLRGADLDDRTVIPTGESWLVYRTQVIPALLSNHQAIPELVARSWGVHDWTACPMAIRFGVHNPADIPALWQPRVEQFIQFFDARLLDNLPQEMGLGEAMTQVQIICCHLAPPRDSKLPNTMLGYRCAVCSEELQITPDGLKFQHEKGGDFLCNDCTLLYLRIAEAQGGEVEHQLGPTAQVQEAERNNSPLARWLRRRAV